MNRRQLLQSLAAMGVAGRQVLAATATGDMAAAAPADFHFVFFTDTHIQPELKAAAGCGMCFQSFHGIPADFAICGGDLVFDAAGVEAKRAEDLYRLFQQTSGALPFPVHYTLGNHDVFGLLSRSGVATTDPRYGKKAFEDRYGPTHYSFDHKGWHFVVLDSIGMQPDRTWIARVGDEQIAWLKADLAKTGETTPVIVVSHVPLVTGAISYVSHAEWTGRTGGSLAGLIDTLMVTDASAVIDALLGYNVRAVLQGHTHVNEDITFRGIRFITSGAVSGNWWKGTRAGSPEGYLEIAAHRDGQIVPRYRTYGFHSVSS